MRLDILKALNEERAARRAAVVVTDVASGEQRFVKKADVATDPLRDWEHKSPLDVITGLNDALIAAPAAAYAHDTLEAIDAFKPDVVVSQELLMGVMMAAESIQRVVRLTVCLGDYSL